MEFRALRMQKPIYIPLRGRENEKQGRHVGKWSPMHLQIIRPRNKSLSRYTRAICVRAISFLFFSRTFFVIQPIRPIAPSRTMARGKILTRELFRRWRVSPARAIRPDGFTISFRRPRENPSSSMRFSIFLRKLRVPRLSPRLLARFN